jgi:hypothetical protein
MGLSTGAAFSGEAAVGKRPMKEWIDEEFGSLELGDKRLSARMKLILERLTQSPSCSIKSAFKGWKEVNAAYRFFNNPQVTADAILAPHREGTLGRVQPHAQVLVLQDTTELDYSTQKSIEGIGPLSCLERKGLFVHHQFVVTPERLPLGIWNLDIYAREEAEHGKAAERKQKPIEEKESFRWVVGYRDACALAESAPGVQVISCADREADVYEMFAEWHRRGEEGKVRADWLIRSDDNRRLSPPEDRGEQADVFWPAKIREAVAATPVLGSITFGVQRKVQQKKQKGGSRHATVRSARMVTQEIRATTLTLAPPYRQDRKMPSVTFRVVMARELHPPEGEEPIDWVLLTSMPVVDFDSAQRMVELYLCRWEIEVFHRVLKTGCGVEKLQRKEAKRITVAVAMYMIVAWRVLFVMTLGRECPDLPCDAIFEEDEWQALWVIAYSRKALEKKPSLGEFVKTLAQFGGFLGRKGDGNPGPAAIWVGLSRLRDFTLAWQLFGITAQSSP